MEGDSEGFWGGWGGHERRKTESAEVNRVMGYRRDTGPPAEDEIPGKLDKIRSGGNDGREQKEKGLKNHRVSARLEGGGRLRWGKPSP